jgi:hypothetical protein
MAINQIKQKRMATEMIRIVHECDAGMKQGVQYYRSSAAAGYPDAQDLLRRAARLPYRVEARIQNVINTYGASNLNSALALVSTLTLADLAAELAPLKTYSDQIKSAYQGGATLDEIADHIELNRADIDVDESVPVPPAYWDDF